MAVTAKQQADQTGLYADRIEAEVDAVFDEDLYWFPVRHHSATVARHLDAVILSRRPRVVFIEGPSEATSLVPYIVARKSRPPIAIYSSYRDDGNVLGLAGIASLAADIPARFACWYPLVEYSPEYVAMKAAQKVGAEVVFIDLPHYALIKPPSCPDVDGDDKGHATEQSEGNTAFETRESDDALLAGSSFYQRLAEAAGYRSWDEGWDSLFEFGRADDDPEEFRRELAAFCAAARATCSAERIAADGTLERERHMWRAIQSGLAERRIAASDAIVVCGGFHLFLDRTDETEPPASPPGTVYTTVVPYSNFRISELSGYAVGNRAPRFYGLHWESFRDGSVDLVADYAVQVLQRARKLGETVSAADAISVTQHARMLSALRGRETPVLDDLHDALITCCCKGDPAEQGLVLQRAIDDVDIGTQVGRVTPDLDRLPIVDDFHRQVDRLELADAMSRERRTRLELDKRDALDAQRSALLHRLSYLGIPLCTLTEAPPDDFATGLIFREKWALKWSPEVESKLIEQTLYGDSVESATLARLRESLAGAERRAGHICGQLLKAIDLDLPDLVRELEQVCGPAIDEDSRFVSLSEALGYLTIIDRRGIYREQRSAVLQQLIVRCFSRACFSINDVVAVPEDQHPDVVRSLLRMAEIVLRGTFEGIDRELFAEHVRNAAAATPVPYLRGVFLGLLAEMRELSSEELAAEIRSLAQAPQDRLVTAGELLEGVLSASRTSVLLGAESLIAAIDELLRSAEWDTFLVMLPRMRAAFEQLHERQRDSVALTVAERYGLRTAERLTELSISPAAAARIAEIDRRVGEILKKWKF